MTHLQQIQAAIFDMDGLLIDSEPLWEQAENEIIASLGVDISERERLPETLGLRIDLVVALWFKLSPWKGPSCEEVTQRIINRVIDLVKHQRPLMPGVTETLQLCKEQGLKVGLASASPLSMQEMVLDIFSLRDAFDVLASAEALAYSKPHPQVYLNAAESLGISPLHCVTLEDSVNGMIASKAARMRSIVVPAAHMFSDPRWSLADVKRENLLELTVKDLT